MAVTKEETQAVLKNVLAIVDAFVRFGSGEREWGLNNSLQIEVRLRTGSGSILEDIQLERIDNDIYMRRQTGYAIYRTEEFREFCQGRGIEPIPDGPV